MSSKKNRECQAEIVEIVTSSQFPPTLNEIRDKLMGRGWEIEENWYAWTAANVDACVRRGRLAREGRAFRLGSPVEQSSDEGDRFAALEARVAQLEEQWKRR